MSQKNNLGGNVLIILICVVIIGILAFAFGSSDNSYRETLESGQHKYYSGQPMTQQEYNAVKGFNDWKDSQGSKTYDNWGN